MFHVHNRKSTAQSFVHPSGKNLELQVGINRVSDELVELFRNKIDYDPMISIVEVLDAPVNPLSDPEPDPAPEPDPEPQPSLAPAVESEPEPEAPAAEEKAEEAEEEKADDKPRGRGRNK